MPENKKIVLGFTFIFFLLSSVIFCIVDEEINSPLSSETGKNPRSSGHFVLDYIAITGATWSSAVAEPWCNGSGLESDPYVIHDVVIEYNNYIPIYIGFSSAYFTLKNCTVFGSPINPGVYLWNVTNGNITDNHFHNNYIGMLLSNSSNNIITENTFNDNQYFGIVLSYSDYNLIDRNTFRNNGHFGITFNRANYNTISNNRFIDNGIACWGIDETLNFGNVFEGNICEFDYLSYFTDPLGIANIVFIIISPFVAVLFFLTIRKYKLTYQRNEKHNGRDQVK